MASRIYTRIDKKGISLIKGRVDNAMQSTCEWLLTEITNAGVVPHDTGNLQRSVKIQKVNGTYRLIYDTKIGDPAGGSYALANYINKRKVRFKKGRRDHWADPWITGSRKVSMLMAFKRFYGG